VAYDKQAKIGSKGSNKFWYEYKNIYALICNLAWLINKVAVTPVNVTDAKGLKYVLPKKGAVYAKGVLYWSGKSKRQGLNP
jgi:hypothetical protein